MNNQVSQESAEKVVKESLLLIPNLLKLLYRLLKDKAITLTDRTLVIATIAYVLSPLDFLPDMIPFLGQVDDILLVALVLKRLMDSVSPEVLTSYWDGDEDLLNLIEKVLNFAVHLVPEGVYRRLVKKANPADYVDVEYKTK
ncbi:MAG: DUF1232 domain-containing protein [Syntrophomonadaceae bacterium]|nr:DUF1232 domain-containing protein [Syntrophomonadaceae bacterium]MDD3890289.1 DUF1232 domain-containing protein [Syntrophomonadaceae bacterium]MDD4549589.1 DUF1232 domain-containing protein [Syntrophomonadaceae bacterium]